MTYVSRTTVLFEKTINLRIQPYNTASVNYSIDGRLLQLEHVLVLHVINPRRILAVTCVNMTVSYLGVSWRSTRVTGKCATYYSSAVVLQLYWFKMLVVALLLLLHSSDSYRYAVVTIHISCPNRTTPRRSKICSSHSGEIPVKLNYTVYHHPSTSSLCSIAGILSLL